MSAASKQCSVIVVPRDRFSTTFACLENVLANTESFYELIVVMGGMPQKIKNRLVEKYGTKVRFIFEPDFLNPAEARNIGLKGAKTELAALLDNDVRVLGGWLEALLKCQSDTGASMVVPLLLENEKTIHTAGNDFYITYKNQKAYASKVLREYKQVFLGKSNLKRVRTDYGELHCQLVHVKTALDLGVYDEKILEVGECDSGLTWAKAGHSLWFEPESVVIYDFPRRIDCVEDIRFFAWRWDMRSIRRGYLYFKEKWNIDISESGQFKYFLLAMNGKLGLLPRVFPSRVSLVIDHFFTQARSLAEKGMKSWRYLRAYFLGFFEWKKDET